MPNTPLRIMRGYINDDTYIGTYRPPLDHAGSVMLAAYVGARAFWLSQAIEALQVSRCDLKIAHFGADL